MVHRKQYRCVECGHIVNRNSGGSHIVMRGGVRVRCGGLRVIR